MTDEPLYAHYLLKTGLDHPGRAETVSTHETDWRKVADWLTGPIPGGHALWYQKHMAHHLLPEIDQDWIGQLTNCFLIRDPHEMLTSLMEFIPDPRVEDTGLPQQVDLFAEETARTGTVPPVIDGRDVLQNPSAMLRSLCRRLGLEFSEAMLNWPPGVRETDGAWAPYWYNKVTTTTGFGEYRPKQDKIPGRLMRVYDRCVDYYNELSQHRLVV